MTSQAALPVEVQNETIGVAVVRLRGEHGLSGRPMQARALSEASEQPLVLVDFSDCSFIDSSVIETLAQAHDGARARGGSLEAVIPPAAGASRDSSSSSNSCPCAIRPPRLLPTVTASHE